MKFPRAAAKLMPTIPAHTTIPMMIPKIPPSESAIAVNGIASAIDTIANDIGL